MKINFFDKLNILFKAYGCLLYLFPRHIFGTIINPVDSTRYTEFAYLLKFLGHNLLPVNSVILDISSPFMMSYLLSKKAKVIKTDINPAEGLYVKSSKNLSFKLEDATHLSFADNSFDLVYSISVIEHIYNGYSVAISEMIRVCKPGGLIYITFPVSEQYTEEWLSQDIYSHQYKEDKRVFFQYRFDKNTLDSIIDQVKGVEILSKDIYWERVSGAYDQMTRIMRSRLSNRYLEKIRMAVLNLYYGFFLLENEPAGFDKAKKLGNVSLILRKN